MTENEAIEILRNNFPKTCRMVDGRYKGGFDDTECEFGKALLLSISVLEEIRQYRAIGTVGECREARERQKAKKPVKDEYNHDCCPNCGWIVYQDEYGGRYLPHCENCGQALDWYNWNFDKELRRIGK